MLGPSLPSALRASKIAPSNFVEPPGRVSHLTARTQTKKPHINARLFCLVPRGDYEQKYCKVIYSHNNN